MAAIAFTGTRDELRAMLRTLPAALAGTAPDPLGLATAIQLRAGNALLSKITEAFIVKSRGGTDEAGIKWPPLAESTVMRRRQGPADRKAMTIKARISALSETQQKAVRREIRRRYAQMVARGLPAYQAEGLARAQAFEAVRRTGGQIPTRRAILGGRQVDILRDTGRLLASLSPGVDDRRSNAEGQILETAPGRVSVGTNVEYAVTHQYGSARVPARPMWPNTGDLPAAWWEAILGAVQRGILKAVAAALPVGRGGQP